MNEAGWEYSPKGFLDAYYESPKVVSYRAVEGHPLAQCLQNLRDNGGSKWQGTPTALLKALNEIAAHLNIDTDQAMWPKAAHMLTRRLEEIKSSLVESGIAYNNRLQRTAEGGSPKRIIRLAFSQKKDNTIRDSAEDKS